MPVILFFFLCIAHLYSYSQNLVDQTSINKIIWQLDSNNKIERNIARLELEKLGETYLEEWAKIAPKLNYLGRREIATLLGKFRSQKSLAVLLVLIEDEDYGVRNHVYLSLLELCEYDPKILEQIPQKNKHDIEKFWDTYYAKKVEAGLEELVSPQGGFGSYEGQFNNMLYLKENAIPVLIEIFDNDNYQYVHTRLQYNTEITYKMRYLAGQAFPYFQEFFGKNKEKVLEILFRMKDTFQREKEQLKEIAKTSLYFLGHKEYLNQDILELKLRAERFQDVEACAELGHLYLRINQEETGVRYLKMSIKIAPRYAHAHYNLACAYACLGKEDLAMESLELAVEYGYDDVAWILKDGDLRILRNNPKFKKLVQDLENRFMLNPENMGK